MLDGPGMAAVSVDARGVRPARRGVVALGALVSGIVLARCWPGAWPEPWLAAACGLCAAALLTRGWWCRVCLCLAMAGLGGGVFSLRVYTVPADSLGRLVATPERAPVTLEGVVLDVPVARSGEVDSMHLGLGRSALTRFRFAVSHAATDAGIRRASGEVVVWIAEKVETVRAGDRLRLRGYLTPIAGPLNPGERDARLWSAQEHLVGRVSITASSLVTPATQPADWADAGRAAVATGLGWLRGHAAHVLDRALAREPEAVGLFADPDAGTLLGALLLGREDPELAGLNDRFARLGLVHVLSISGFHLVVMAQVVLLLVRLTGDRGAWEAAIAGALVVGYVLIVPAEAPVVRSACMVLSLLLAQGAGRRYDRVNLLAWIACALLLWRPMDAFAAGFQLSFGVTAALLWLGRQTRERLFPPPIRGLVGEGDSIDPGLRSLRATLRQGAETLVASSLLAWAVATPIVIAHTGVFSPLAALTSIVLIPAFVVLLWLGFGVLLIGAVIPMVAGVLGPLLMGLAHAIHAATLWLDGWWWMAVDVPPVSAAWAAAATAVIVWWFAGRRGVSHDPRRWWASVAVLAWLLFTMTQTAWGWRAAGPGGASVTALAVGPGRATMLAADGQTVLWGAGSISPGAVRRALPRAVRGLGWWRVRTVIVPSADPREWAGLLDVAPALGVQDVYAAPGALALAREHPFSRAVARLRQRGVRVGGLGDGDQLTLGSMRLTVRWAADGSRLWGQIDGAPRPIRLLGSLRAAEARAVGVEGAAAAEWPDAGALPEEPGVFVWSSTTADRGADREGKAWVTGRDGALRLAVGDPVKASPALRGLEELPKHGLSGLVSRLLELLF